MTVELYSIFVNQRTFKPRVQNPQGNVPPLRQIPDGEGGLIQINISFSTSDQYNWKSHSKG